MKKLLLILCVIFVCISCKDLESGCFDKSGKLEYPSSFDALEYNENIIFLLDWSGFYAIDASENKIAQHYDFTGKGTDLMTDWPSMGVPFFLNTTMTWKAPF